MEQNNSGDIDITQVFSWIKTSLKQGAVLFFKAMDFILKKWKIIALLLIAGFACGYFMQQNQKQTKEANYLIKINFNAANYVYNEIDLINKKIEERDSVFLTGMGLAVDTLEVQGLKISPIVNFNDILSNYGSNGRYLDGLLKNVEFEEKDVEISKTFTTDYKYHMLYYNLSEKASIETTKIVLKYINSNELLEKIKSRRIKNLEERIANNYKIISQIDKVIDTYNSNQSLSSPSNEIFVVDKNFNIEKIIERKINLQRDIENRKEDLLYSNDIVVQVNEPILSYAEKSFSSNKKVYYPVLFVFIFLFLAFLKKMYFSIKKIAFDEDLN